MDDVEIVDRRSLDENGHPALLEATLENLPLSTAGQGSAAYLNNILNAMKT